MITCPSRQFGAVGRRHRCCLEHHRVLSPSYGPGAVAEGRLMRLCPIGHRQHLHHRQISREQMIPKSMMAPGPRKKKAAAAYTWGQWTLRCRKNARPPMRVQRQTWQRERELLWGLNWQLVCPIHVKG
jgi:hypothetical protein